MNKFLRKFGFNKLKYLHLYGAAPIQTCHVHLNLPMADSLSQPLTPLKPQKSVYQLDNDTDSSNKPLNSVNKYTNRTHTCGELNINHVGHEVVLCGWLGYQRMNKFIVLRDGYGETQLLINDEHKNIQNKIQRTPYESVIQVKGTVLARPKDMINVKQKTGEIEIQVDELQVINQARDVLPFSIREFQMAKEALRMQYRYLDIRFRQMQRNLRIRSKLFMKMREFLINNHFVDVETPILFKATPGGAQEFVVPTRFPGKFYSLVQSPQQFKQMLMAGALDRYFQIAKCFRDEGSRSDRQLEFTQLDIELSFTSVEGVVNLIEELLFYSLPELFGEIPRHFLQMPYEEALETYGSDKPDISFPYKLQNCTDILKGNSKLNREKNFGAYLVDFTVETLQDACILNKSIKEMTEKIAGQHPGVKLIQSKIVREDWPGKMQKIFSVEESNQILSRHCVRDGSVLFIAYGNKDDARNLLGKIRLEYVKLLEEKSNIRIRHNGNHFLWIVDFPLFKFNTESGGFQSAHHPFTAPHPDDLKLLDEDPLKVRALAYDLVLNGYEVGGGSVRIHDPVLQEKILKLLEIEKDNLQHIVDMLGSGCPPHGGIALGLDRLLAVLLNASSIRDVIAFPKTFEGKDPLSHAPSKVTEEILRLYHIKSIT
ncbi:aspartate--tRNA ligase, mitochondrial-like [Euwallacea similis]|uniref:aspartate--tRNA ligase, mitochondrial-like n=1 Tax=Euwallacea similis TaxID=1736056 RepID=UPI00344E32FF